MPWNNAWSGAGGVVASSLKVIDSNGNIVASIDSQGNIVGANLNIAGSIFYQGEELSQIFQQFAFGRITSAFLSGSTFGPFGTTGPEKLLVQTQFTYNHGRSIWMYIRNMNWTFAGNTTPGGIQLNLRAKLASGGNVVLADPGIAIANGQNNISGFGVEIGSFRECNFSGPPWNFADGSVINVALSVIGLNNVGANGSVQSSDDIYMVVTDMGTQSNPGNTTNLFMATPPPAQTFKSFEKACFDSQSYQQGGSASSGSGATQQTYMYFGQDPAYAPNGNWRSYCWFDTASGGGNGLGSLGDIVGVSSGQLQYLDVFVYADWFYFIAGGTLYVGMTGSSPNHSSEPGGSYRIVPMTYSGRGQGQWVSLLGTSIQTAVLGGTFTGFTLGPGPTTALQYYGYADGASRGQPMRIRGGYYK